MEYIKLVQFKLFVYGLGELKVDWNADGAEIVSQKAIKNTLKALDILYENDLIPSKVIPVTNGGITLFIDRDNGKDIFEFYKDGTMRIKFIDDDRENFVKDIFSNVESLLEKFILNRSAE